MTIRKIIENTVEILEESYGGDYESKKVKVIDKAIKELNALFERAIVKARIDELEMIKTIDIERQVNIRIDQLNQQLSGKDGENEQK